MKFMQFTRNYFFLIILSLVVHNQELWPSKYKRVSHIDLSNKLKKSKEKSINKRCFIENKGQWHADVLFLARMENFDAWITKYGVNYVFYKIDCKKKINHESISINDIQRITHEQEKEIILGHRIILEFIGHNPNPETEALHKQEGYYNYFIGNDQTQHTNFVSRFNDILIKDVYPGIDIKYYFENGYLRYDFIVHPGADPNQIKFRIKGPYNTRIENNQQLSLITRFGKVLVADLNTFQKDGTKVKSRFRKCNDYWQILVGNYDNKSSLIIDPIIYSTFLGGNGGDWLYRGIEVDANENVYVVGKTWSSNYDITPGTFQTIYGGGGSDIFVTKLNYTGSSLIYSTFIGGTQDEEGLDIAVDNYGNAYITGWTNSTDYPVTSGAFQTTHLGGFDFGFGYYTDVIVTKLNSLGTSLSYSTYLGGSFLDYGRSIALDENGNVYITGMTGSSDYDVTPGAFQTSFAGGSYDAFITKLNQTGSDILYSSYLGGSSWDEGNGIDIDINGNAYLTGSTYSNDFPTTPGVYQTANAGYYDVFVTKFNPTGSQVLYSTLIGGNASEYGLSIKVDYSGSAFVTGYTGSSNFDVTSGALQVNYGGGDSDAFITRLNSTGSSLLYSTYLGGNNYDYGRDITIDNNLNAYVVGYTFSPDFDITPDALQQNFLGGSVSVDGFISKINASGTELMYSTYIGGSDIDYGFGITLDNTGNIYVPGHTSSIDFPITSSAFQTLHGGGFYDAFITKLCLGSPSFSLTSGSNTDNQIVCINTPINTINYLTTGATGATIAGLPPGINGNFNSNTITINGVPTTPGVYNYVISLSGTCGNANISGSIIVIEENTISLISLPGTDSQKVCINTAINEIIYNTTGATGAIFNGLPPGVNGAFNAGTIIISGTPSSEGNYSYDIILTGGCGNVSASGNIIVECASIMELNSEIVTSDLDIFPNPTQNKIIVKNVHKNGKIIIISPDKKIIKEINTKLSMSDSVEIDLTSHNAGLYIILYFTESTGFKVGKILKI